MSAVLAPAAFDAAAEEEPAWTDATNLTVEGKGWTDTERFYDRLPARAKGNVDEMTWDRSHDSAGMAVRFLTLSPSVQIRWKLTRGYADSPVMPASGMSGVDFYMRTPAGWWWRPAGPPDPAAKELQTTTVTIGEGSPILDPIECMVYLPLYNGVDSVEIGVPKGMKVEPGPVRKRKPIVFYGHSIVQGGQASRPGSTASAIAGRRLDGPILNLGFSGRGLMTAYEAELLAELDPAVYVVDTLWNMDVTLIRERAGPFIRRLCQAHPGTPVVLVEDYNYRNTRVPTDKGKSLRAAGLALRAQGMTNLYYLAQEHVLGIDGEGLVDGSHLSNLGFMRQAENYLTVLNPLVLGAGWEALKDSDMGWFCEDDVLKAAQERLHAKDYENARQGFKQAMRRGRWWVMVDAQLGLAEAYQADGKMAEAKAAYLKALDLPRLTLVQRAMLKQRLFSIAKDTDKNPDQAREYLHGWRADYLSALEDKKVHDHEKTTAVYLLGYSYSTGIGYPDEMNAEQARRMWAQVEALKNPHPGYLPRVYMEWARSCLDAKQYAETRRLCEKLLALSGLDPDTRANALLLSGNASLAEGDTAGAKDAYGRAIALPGISEGMKRQVLSRLKLSDNPQ